MAPSKNAEREAREARDRLRRYNARQAVHGNQLKRRRRDNLWAIIGVIVVVGLATLTQVVYFTAGPGTPAPSASPSASPSAAAGANTGDVPSKTIAAGRTWTGKLGLNGITLGISLDGKKAPQAVSAVISLAQQGFYTSTGSSCHRLTTSDTAKLIQCGSVNGDGTGDPGFTFGPLENVPSDGVYPAGTIAMARGTGEYSQSSQFFITYGDSTLADATGGYTVVGTVTSGLDAFVSQIADKGVADGSTDGTPAVPTKITELTVQ
ncbi:MAG TPA: peptidylprolyl isomerase [Lacisediminihabitans sp.]|uniref:peptidylprolyl isomerase n=1 Tax=Lacisediminihabitans sp. TaxID=2787631 RepID=UPI002ED922F9